MSKFSALDLPVNDLQPSASRLLRRNRSTLIERLSSPAVEEITDKLYEKEVISKDEMENINSSTTSKTRARSLLSIMDTRSWTHGIEFARLLQQMDGMQDIGTSLLEIAGAPLSGRQTSDNQACKTGDASEVIAREECQTLSGEDHNYKEKEQEHRLIETSLRHKLEIVESVRYLDTEQTVTWKALPHFLPNETCTVNCVAAVGNATVATHWTGTDLCTLKKEETEWTTHKGSQLSKPIRNVFSYKNTCYVAAGDEDKSIYTWDLVSHAWQHVTSMPKDLRNNIHFSLVTKDNHIYMLGGLNGCQPLNTAMDYDINSDTWCSLPNIPFTSFLCSAFFIDNILYVTGGRTKHCTGKFKAAMAVAALDMNEPMWRSITELNHRHASVTALHNRIIATGGESLDGHVVSNVEMFDTISSQWLPLPAMDAAHYYHGVCAMEDNSLVVVGGYGNLKCEYLRL